MKYIVKLNQKVYEVEIEKAGMAQPAMSPQPTAAFPQPAATTALPAPASNAENIEIECPMPGKILSISVSVGQRVRAGECLMIMEAMKMENEMVAPKDGTVKQILVSQGTMVNTGDVLAVLI